MSAIVLEVVNSAPFRMKVAEGSSDLTAARLE